jgi:hypothetical protein
MKENRQSNKQNKIKTTTNKQNLYFFNWGEMHLSKLVLLALVVMVTASERQSCTSSLWYSRGLRGGQLKQHD